MGEIFEDSRLRQENEKLRIIIDAMAKALTQREAVSIHPAWEVSADPLLIAENTKLKEALRECVHQISCVRDYYTILPNDDPKLVYALRKAREVLGDDKGESK